MTNKEKLIDIIQFETGHSKDDIEKIFEAVNKYEGACFCSQMGDYDHPEERIAAKRVLNKELKEFDFMVAYEVFSLLDGNSLNPRQENIARFYNRRFHKMDDECVESSFDIYEGNFANAWR